MERATVTAALLCLTVNIFNGVHSSPFLFPEPDCDQPTQVSGSGYDGYQSSVDYEETLNEFLRTFEEIVYVTVRVVKEEFSQLVNLWLPPCNSGETALPEAEISHGGWVQGQYSTSGSPENNSGAEESALDNKIGEGNTSSSSSSESSTNGTRKKTTVTQNTAVVTQVQTVGGSTTSTSKDIVSHTTSSDDSDTVLSTEMGETTTENAVISSNSSKV